MRSWSIVFLVSAPNPNNNYPITASPKDIDVAVAAAREAFKTTWGKNVTGFERSRLINKLADLIERDQQELAEIETLNNGKPVKIARYASPSLSWWTCRLVILYLWHMIGTLTSEILSSVFVIMPDGRTKLSARLINSLHLTTS